MSRNGLRKLLSLTLLLSTVAVIAPTTASAATAGSGACQQTFTVTGTGEVAVFESGGFCFVAFKNTGLVNTQAVFSWTRPSSVTSADVLVVGGGGGGGSRHGGGGGAGGFVQTDSYAISSASTIAIAVGAGGSASASSSGTSGQGSYFKATTSATSGLIAVGGGAGSSGAGSSGGSGGGAGSGQTPGSVTAQSQSTFAGVNLSGINFGNSGAAGAFDTNLAGDSNDYWAGGGGGGAAGSGTLPLSNGSQVTSFANYSSSTARGGNGGDGRSVSWITSTVASNLVVGQTSSGTVYFAGGGGGGIGVDGQSAGTGGLGGGANGTKTESTGNAGAAFTGGGGGGSGFDDINKAGSTETVGNPPGGVGGSGIVLLRFLAPDITAPTISVASYATTSGSDNLYALNDTITVRLTFSETVTVTGTPRIPVQGLISKFATYRSGSGSLNLDFSYVVALGDEDRDGVSFAGNSLDLNGGTIQDLSSNNAVLTFSTLTAAPFAAVDGVIPTVSTVATATNGNSIEITLSETQSAIALSGTPFLVTVNGVRDTVTAATQSGPRITLTLTFGIISGDTVLITYTDPTANNDIYALQDLAGNDVATFSTSVTNASVSTSNVSITLALNPSSTTANYRAVTTVRVTVNTAARVDFFHEGKIIANCRNIVTSSNIANCSWKPSKHAFVNLTARVRPTVSGFIDASSEPLRIFVIRRAGSR